MNHKTAILYVTHVYNEEIGRQIDKLERESREYAELYVGYQRDKTRIELPDGMRAFSFDLKELNALNYHPWRCTVMDGNFHYVLLDFYQKHPGYDYYWLVEYDVRFTGDWQDFFGFFADRDEDFVSAHLETVEDNPNWDRWHEIEMADIEPDRQLLLHSFNPICRTSHRALSLLHERCRLGDRGHYELLMPTLFRHFGLKIADMGGQGRYAYPGYPDLFYTDNPLDPSPFSCTHRYRPTHTEVNMTLPRMIYHPVK